LIRINDEQRIAPKGVFKKVLTHCKPALILIDELADYCISASAVPIGVSNLSDQTISFMQELTEVVSEIDTCVLIVTLPASVQELTSSAMSSQILTALENKFQRIATNMKPVEDEEIFEVVRRRLFEDLGDPSVLNAVVGTYFEMYKGMANEIPSYAVQSNYRERLKKSYPFHPELIDIFRLRWASNPFFQRTRGVLRILAAIVSDLWKRQQSLTGNQFMIHTSDITLANVEALTSQITILNGPEWDSVISADISGSSSNAFKIDNDKADLGKNSITQGVASTILLATFGVKGQNQGVGMDEIKLCMAKPNFNANDINAAIHQMENRAHYLYYSTKRYWFDKTPNVNILINQAIGDIKSADINAEILKRIADKTKQSNVFNVLLNSSEDITEQIRPTLVILNPKYFGRKDGLRPDTEELIKKLATKKGNSERLYRNTMLFLVQSEIGSSKQANLRTYLACQKISSEYQSQLSVAQKDDIRKRIEEANKLADSALVSAYSLIVKHSVKHGVDITEVTEFKDTFDAQISTNIVAHLKQQEWLLETVGWSPLEKHNLLPTLTQPVRVKDIYEAFIRFDDKPMILNSDAVKNGLQRYCTNGAFCIATGDGTTFTRYFFKEKVNISTDDGTYWLIDKSLIPQPEPTSPTTSSNSTTSAPPRDPSVSEPKTPVSGGEAHESEPSSKALKSITISGKVPLERYTELFNYFVSPFVMNAYKMEIEVSFKIKSSESNPIDETKQLYKNAKEAAQQLNLNFKEE
jgi:intergrase/recombinase